VSGFIGQTVQTWIGFFSADGREVATSILPASLASSDISRNGCLKESCCKVAFLMCLFRDHLPNK
jgi:hypothetical protein